MQELEKVGIRNLHSVFGRGARGGTLSRRCYMGQVFGCIRTVGVKVIIDFRTADHNDKFTRRCADTGIVYHHMPTDAQVTPSEELFKTLCPACSRHLTATVSTSRVSREPLDGQRKNRYGV